MLAVSPARAQGLWFAPGTGVGRDGLQEHARADGARADRQQDPGLPSRRRAPPGRQHARSQVRMGVHC